MELANRNHSITNVSPLKSTKPHKNIRDIVGEDMDFFSEETKSNVFEMRLKKQSVLNPLKIADFFEKICLSYYNMSEVLELRNEKFDLIFVSTMMNDCAFGLVYHLQTPFIFISPASTLPPVAALTGTPSPASFVPHLFLGFSDHMNFLERVGNLVGQMMYKLSMDLLYIRRIEKVYRDALGEDTPSVHEIQQNVSLIIANSHPTLNYARPLLPDIIEVGGMACRPATPLPKDLEDFITGAGKDGVIYFSMGSIIKADTMPESYRKIFVNAFSKLKQRVLWKWETEEMEDLSNNVKLAKWLPQQDVLGHPNVKMFITHGGLGGIVEAVYHGVPMIGIPFYGDQDTNLRQTAKLGFSLTLDFSTLTEESILSAINTLLNEPKYTQRVKELSSVYRDRPQPPLETAVYWTEYIMRHKGATHLRSPARDLNWFQYHSFDAVAFVATICALVLYILFITCRSITRKLCGATKNVTKAKKLN